MYLYIPLNRGAKIPPFATGKSYFIFHKLLFTLVNGLFTCNNTTTMCDITCEKSWAQVVLEGTVPTTCM